jgi:ribonuclease PH
VIEADGGTRTASIVGGFMALAKALQRIQATQAPSAAAIAPARPILRHFVAAVSVGIVEGEPMLDLCYVEDSEAEVDMNVVRTDKGHFVEVQGTGEESTYSREQLNAMLDLAEKGCNELVTLQRKFLGNLLP